MANLYTADWHLLFNEEDAALAAYRRSYEELSYAGRQPDELEDFCDSSVLPVHDFHSSLAAASTFGQGVKVEQSDSIPSANPSLLKEQIMRSSLWEWGLASRTPVHPTQ